MSILIEVVKGFEISKSHNVEESTEVQSLKARQIVELSVCMHSKYRKQLYQHLHRSESRCRRTESSLTAFNDSRKVKVI